MTAALARAADPQTSFEAAWSVNVPDLEAAVLKALKLSFPSGATSHELAEHMGLSLVSVSPRMKPLRARGLVKHSDVRRRGSSGRFSIVWMHT